jgi:hypothetical protein
MSKLSPKQNLARGSSGTEVPFTLFAGRGGAGSSRQGKAHQAKRWTIRAAGSRRPLKGTELWNVIHGLSDFRTPWRGPGLSLEARWKFC